MSDVLAGSNDYTLDIEGSDKFDVREFTVDDGLSSLFAADIVVVSTNPAVDLETLVGKPAKFTIQTSLLSTTKKPMWTGVVSEVHQLLSEPTGLSTYHVTLSPRMWLLTQRTNCRIWQQMTDLDVVKELLGEWNLAPQVECTRTYKTRKYRVQYQESDYTFVCRLLEASGITYLFREVDGVSKIVLRDSPERGELREEPIEHTNEPNSGIHYATRFRASRAVRPGKVTFADHDPRLPNTPLTGEAVTGDHPVEAQLEHFVYMPGAFKYGVDGPRDTPTADDRGRHRTDPGEAKRVAEESAAARIARSQRFAFDSNHLDLVAGLRVRILSHAVAEKHGEMLITRVVFSGASSSMVHVSADAVSASVPFRPDAVTPQPVIHGVECGTVVGPEGETIHTDEFGRVRVQFHWDRYGQSNEQSSCWMQVNEPWAGGGLGSINIPRIGQEVMVSFLAGNPEEPMIVGRMHTNLLRPPFPLPANKTQSGFKSASVPHTGGWNEMMFEDKAGSELINVRGEKDMKTRINHDQTLSVGRNRQDTIEANDTEQVQGDQRHTVFQNVMSQIGQNSISSVLGNLLNSTGKERILQTIGNFLSDALTHTITSKESTTISVGQSTIIINPDSIIIQTPKLYLNPGTSAAQTIQMGGSMPSPSSEN